MTGTPLLTSTDVARVLGVSRQAFDQARARSDKPPEPAMVLHNGMKLWREEEVREWWDRHREEAWKEVRENRRGPSSQVSARFSAAEIVRMDKLRGPGQTRASVLRAIALRGLEACETDGAP